jgi:enamine deaminase RidA (YjgF/YER057c/UK114 family)
MSDIDARLADLGITLPEPVAPVANYVPFVQSGNTVHISGQISIGADGLVAARVGADMDLASAQAAARLCGINLIAQIQSGL